MSERDPLVRFMEALDEISAILVAIKNRLIEDGFSEENAEAVAVTLFQRMWNG